MQKTSKTVIRRNVLPTRIIITCALTALVGIGGIITLLFQINTISEQYRNMIAGDYNNIQYMSEISQELYLHQALMYKYISTEEADKRHDIQVTSEQLKTDIEKTLVTFGYNMKGNANESYYHNIYSSATGYFYDINRVFSFFESGDINTAKFYIDHAMDECVTSVNKSIDELNSIANADMEKSQAALYMRIHLSRILSIIIVLGIIAFTVFCISSSAKTADEMVSIDSLTGIYNYDKLLRYAAKLEHRGRLREYSVISLNIRDFKYINQLNGSNVGDDILKQFALEVYPLIGRGELFSRSGGDNFILLVKTSNVDAILSRIIEVKLTVNLTNTVKEFVIKSRCGIYDILVSDDVFDALNKASIALNKARISASSFVHFNEKMVDEMMEEKEILSNFTNALNNEEFTVFYQPKVDMPTGRLYGAEALVRWIKDGQFIPPFKFIPILEKDGAVTELDFYVFEHVCSSISRWQKEGLDVVKVSSNFSKMHLQNKKFADDILSIIKKYNIDPKYIEIELTESSGYEDFDALHLFISKMKQANISTSIDDFGTGYSSLSLLQDLDVDVVKLDKSFIDHIGDDNKDIDNKTRKVVQNVVRLVNDLDKSVICEGVETDIQASFLVGAGCNTAQGYLYNKPLPKDEFEAKLKNPQYELVI